MDVKVFYKNKYRDRDMSYGASSENVLIEMDESGNFKLKGSNYVSEGPVSEYSRQDNVFDGTKSFEITFTRECLRKLIDFLRDSKMLDIKLVNQDE